MTFAELWQTKHKIIIPSLIGTLIFVIIVGCSVYLTIQENRRIDAESVTLNENLTVEFGEEAKISDFLAKLEGEIVEDYQINTTQLGEQEVTFDYINIKNKVRSHSFTINVVDTTAPKIYGTNNYAVELNYDGDLTNLMMSGDNADNHPKREILGNYDLAEVGQYPLEYQITDASGNQARQSFTLNVVEPSANKPDTSHNSDKLDFSEVIKQHKTENIKIGIDVSAWQGEIDWEKVKNAGVEFAFIRVGYQSGYDGEYLLDRYFLRNIQAATEQKIPIGVYFYSYANSLDEARQQANWIIEQVRDYPLELGMAFDWENWKDFNEAGMSFHTINQVTDTFLDTVQTSGYPALLYSSKNYLDKIWQTNHPVWLAQYYDHVTYDGDYVIWQMSDSGKVDGIYGDVDLDIMYIK